MEPDDAIDLLSCARALDERLHETLEERFRLRRGRLYGVTAQPGEDEPFKFCFLGEHRDVYELIAGPTGLLARQFDAAIAAVTGWSAPLGDIESGGVARPSLHPQRSRVRVCCAVGDAGVASVMRIEGTADERIDLPGSDIGAMPAALRSMWAGTPERMAARWGDERPSSRPAGRHRRPA